MMMWVLTIPLLQLCSFWSSWAGLTDWISQELSMCDWLVWSVASQPSLSLDLWQSLVSQGARLSSLHVGGAFLFKWTCLPYFCFSFSHSFHSRFPKMEAAPALLGKCKTSSSRKQVGFLFHLIHLYVCVNPIRANIELSPRVMPLSTGQKATQNGSHSEYWNYLKISMLRRSKRWAKRQERSCGWGVLLPLNHNLERKGCCWGPWIKTSPPFSSILGREHEKEALPRPVPQRDWARSYGYLEHYWVDKWVEMNQNGKTRGTCWGSSCWGCNIYHS